MPQVTYNVLARQDLDEIWLHIALENVPAADAFIDRVEERTRLAAQHPRMGRARPELAPDLRSLPLDRYVVFYLPTLNGIAIVRVLHGSRDLAGLAEDGEFD